MEKIPFYTFGTYYTTRHPAPGANADEVRNFVYWLKNKWPCARIDFGHSLHPSQYTVPISSAAGAYDFFAEMIAHHLEDVVEALGISPTADLEFIPVPSSDVVASTIHTARWSGREIARRLEDKGLGRMGLHVVNKYAIMSKGDGSDPDCSALAATFEIVGEIDDSATQIYVDDVLTWGKHVGALHVALGSPPDAGLVAAARTDKTPRNAYNQRLGHVQVTKLGGKLFPSVVAEDPDDEYDGPDPPSDDPW